MKLQISSSQSEAVAPSVRVETMMKERLAQIGAPSAYDFRMLANFYLNARRYEDACKIYLQMLYFASSEGNPDLIQALYQDLGWVALLSSDPEQARLHFSCQRATVKKIHRQSKSEGIYRDSDLNLFVATYRMGKWSASWRHLLRLWRSFKGKKFGFNDFVAGWQESLDGDLTDFTRLRTMVFLETLEQAESKDLQHA
jgi:hypothetical protein